MKKCKQCGNEIDDTARAKMYCDNLCKQKAYDARQRELKREGFIMYDASNIIIQEYSKNRWATAVALAEKYTRSVEWIERSLEACELASAPYEYFVRRYLDGDKTIPLNEDVDLCSAELQKALRHQLKN